MRNQVQLHLLFLLLSLLSNLLLFTLPYRIHAKSVIEPCSSSDSCNSLLSYLLPLDSKISEIASRFQVNISDILGSNSINSTSLASSGNQILRAKSIVKVPILCPCIDGIRRSVSTTYTVQPADTVDSISNGYGGLVSGEQIRSFNGISGQNPLRGWERLVIPLPCTCFNNSDNGVAAVYLSYVVQRGESLSSIGAQYGSTVNELEAINGLAQAGVDPGDILAIPIPACSSANLNWYNESLIVPTGSYALTANNCIRCSCGGPSELHLQCFPSGIATSCSHLQCKGSDIFIGDVYEKQTALGCHVSKCLYRGHSGGKIFRSLENSSNAHCSGNQSYTSASPSASPSSPDSAIPLLTLSPSPSPSPSPSSVPNQTVGTDASSVPAGIQDSDNISSYEGFFSEASCLGLSLLGLVLSLTFW